MNSNRQIALVGDFSPEAIAHRAIPRALDLCGAAFDWVPSADVGDPEVTLADFSGIWLVPASPYKSMEGALAAVRFARESGKPFLGSCGGFQHALIEIARDVAGIADADHAETAEPGRSLVVTPLTCGLVEKSQKLRLSAGTLLRQAYGTDTITEEYHCNYGINPDYRDALTRAGVVFTARDEAEEIRAFELSPSLHPFFVGTLFQSERRALRGERPPVVRAFLKAVEKSKGRGDEEPAVR